MKLSDVGDVLTATPALRALRQTFPTAPVSILVPPTGAAALMGSPLVDEIIVFDKHRFDSPAGLVHPTAMIDALALFRRLRHARFDNVIVLHHLSTVWGARKFALLAKITGAANIVGLDNGRGSFFTKSLVDEGFGYRHEVEYWLEVVRLLGADTDDWRLEISVGPADEDRAEQLLAPSGEDSLIALHAGSGTYSLARRWPVARFAAVANDLARDFNPTFVLVGSSGEVDLTRKLASAIQGKTLDLGGMTTIGELAAVLRRCRLFLGNDSGVMHLACAVGCPTVAVFGPSNHRAWGPWTGHNWQNRATLNGSIETGLPRPKPGREEGSSPRSRHEQVEADSPRPNFAPGRRGKEDGAGDPFARVVRVDLPCSPCLYIGKSVGSRDGCPERTCLDMVTPEMVRQAAEGMLRTHG